MDAAEAAVGHQHDNITGAMFGHNGADNPVYVRNVASALPSPSEVRDKLLR